MRSNRTTMNTTCLGSGTAPTPQATGTIRNTMTSTTPPATPIQTPTTTGALMTAGIQAARTGIRIGDWLGKYGVHGKSALRIMLRKKYSLIVLIYNIPLPVLWSLPDCLRH